MTSDRIERARRALGADRSVPLSVGPARGPLDLLAQADEVARVRPAPFDREGVIVLSTTPVVLAAASLTPPFIPLVSSESA